MLFIFTIVTLVVSGFATYLHQSQIYQEQRQQTMLDLCDYMTELINVDGEDFVVFQDYIVENYEKIDIPIDFDNDDILEAADVYFDLLRKKNPEVAEVNADTFDQLDDEVKVAYTVYNYEYYMRMLHQARDKFKLTYVYYITPTGEPDHMYYVIDAVMEPREEGSEYLLVCDDIYENPAKFVNMWKAWNTGEAPDGFDSFDNKYGKTYAWYTPLYIGDRKMGVICADMDIDTYHHEIFLNTLRQLLTIGVVLVISVIILLWVINRFYIEKIRNLANDVSRYTMSKDPKIAASIEKELSGNDEISALGNQTAAMIMELENYMRSLVNTTKELTQTKEQADNLQLLANRDALTGVRNRMAYEDYVKRLEWRMADGYRDFGFAMVDLNYLKRINDTYGHERGNIAIQRCCQLVCSVFLHSPVYRIGGDEFVVILEHRDLENAPELIATFNEKLEEYANDETLAPWEKTSAAIGYAVFDEEKDSTIANVFMRADKSMYERKSQMKAPR